MDAERSMRRFAVAAAATLLLSLAAVDVAAAQTLLSGTVVSVNRDLNYVTVREDLSGRTFKIDTRGMDTRTSLNVWNLRAGDRVDASGSWSNEDTFRADRVTAPLPRARGRVINDLTGTVESVNRSLNYVTVRDQVTGRSVRVDVRKLDTNRSLNVWQLRPGELVTASGRWANNRRGDFRAEVLNLSNLSPMTSSNSGANGIRGTVESVNRDLNYVIVRDDATRLAVKIDVRQMDTRRSVNVWNLRTGDRIIVNGSWADRDRFLANTVGF